MEAYVIALAVVLFIMIVLSSFFSMSETAFTSVSVFRLKEMAAGGDMADQLVAAGACRTAPSERIQVLLR